MYGQTEAVPRMFYIPYGLVLKKTTSTIGITVPGGVIYTGDTATL